ncbi:MAG: hypothetical protein CMN87_06480 [Stappia sp.]|uniref:hypothetical protein n=1 Tax=Stappia sp. TaxID=1870903 RepID=UPI000C40B38E|nr:hypothetical protein [Stappia sp.]MAA97949.1 hypothetical protein [Stappia sp.]MBM19637.1 hypothetical protein [Stappia sp.]
MREHDTIDGEHDEHLVSDQEIRQMALGYIDTAFADAVADGLDSSAVAHAALFTAFADLVASFGEEAVAELAATLPERVRRGDYTIIRNVH